MNGEAGQSLTEPRRARRSAGGARQPLEVVDRVAQVEALLERTRCSTQMLGRAGPTGLLPVQYDP
jgi:hypothetical protein